MTWLNLPALAGLVAVGVPIFIHLLGRRQARRQKFPTLRFLDVSRLLPTRRTRLTDLLLLLVRAGIVTSAALALAQPVLRTAKRSASLQNTVARAIVVDTSASMFRPAQSGATGLRVVDVARTDAQRAASEATTSLIIETATPAKAIPGAVDWLRRQSGHAAMVMISDFQSGTVDSTDLAIVPADIGIALAPVMATVDTAPITVTVRGGTTITTAKVSLTPEHTAVEWRTASVARDTAGHFPILLTGDGERVAVGAAEHAALTSGVAWRAVANEPIAIVYPGYAQRAELIRAAKPLTQPWMADVVVRIRSDSTLIAAASAADANPAGSVARHAGFRCRWSRRWWWWRAMRPGRPVAVATVGTIKGQETLPADRHGECGQPGVGGVDRGRGTCGGRNDAGDGAGAVDHSRRSAASLGTAESAHRSTRREPVRW